MQPLSHLKPFEVKGEWWRPTGRDLVEAFRSKAKTQRVSLDEGFARLQGERDLLEGTDPAHACRGPLRYDPEPGLRLSLLGSSEVAFPDDEPAFTIHGRTSTGIRCSLLDCVVTRRQVNLPSGFADREVVAHAFVGGAHVESLTELVSDELSVRVPGLVDFLWAPAHDASGAAYGGLGRNQRDTHVVRLESAELSFSVGDRRSSTWHASTQERDAIVRITLRDAISFNEWLKRWVEPLIRIIVLATREPTVVSTVTTTIDDPDQRHAEPGRASRRRQPVQIIYLQRRLPRQPAVRWDWLLVSYASLGDAFDAFITRWWGVHHRLAGAGDFLFGALREPMSLEPRLVTLASAIEGYHHAFHNELEIAHDEHEAIVARMLDVVEATNRRQHYARRLRHANQLVQHDRIRQVIRRSGEVVDALGHKAGRLAAVVTTTRNYFVHLEQRDSRVLEGAALQDATQLLILAIHCNLLLDLGLSPEQARAAVLRAFAGEPFFRALLQRECAWPKQPPGPVPSQRP